MPTYLWKNPKTGEIVEVERSFENADQPPDKRRKWVRVYSFGLGRVEGGGGSPARAAKVKP